MSTDETPEGPSPPRRLPWLAVVGAVVIVPVAWAYAGLMSRPHLRIGMPVHPSALPTWSGPLSELPTDIPEGGHCDWESVGSFLHAADVDLGRVVHPTHLSFAITSGDEYVITLLLDGEAVEQLEPPRVPPPCQGQGMTRSEVYIRPTTQARGFDTVVFAGATVADHCVGAFEFIGEEPPAEAPSDPSGEEPLEERAPEQDG